MEIGRYIRRGLDLPVKPHHFALVSAFFRPSSWQRADQSAPAAIEGVS
jgi:hypothetical protein